MPGIRRREKRDAQNVSEGKSIDNQELILLLSQALSVNQQKPAAQAVAPAARPGDDGIDLMALFWRIVGKLHFVVLMAVICAALGTIYAEKTYVPNYKATAKLYVVSSSNAVFNLSELNMGSALTKDYIEVFSTWEVCEMVNEILGTDYSYGALRGRVSVTNPTGTHLLYVTATSNEAEEAANLANAFAEAGRKFITRNMTADEPNSFSVALIPGSPSSGGKSQYTQIGFLLGSLLVIGIITLQFLLDNHPRTSDDITRCSGLVTLTVIPMETSGKANKKKHQRQMQKRMSEGRR